ncbi:hypothetical protein [Hydrotalea sp.]|uniref:hypothetical protein n=1 Tax=Hydrotalea sp. TaxID=2881279 RepID=UPI0026119C2B|nr:hypothetical protein [Hydrotalea sp.]
MHYKLLNYLLLLCFVLLQNITFSAAAIVHPVRIEQSVSSVLQQFCNHEVVGIFGDSIPDSKTCNIPLIVDGEETEYEWDFAAAHLSLLHYLIPVTECLNFPVIAFDYHTKSILHATLLIRIGSFRI